MTGAESVKNTIPGLPVDRQPIYAWVRSNLTDEITEAFGTVENCEKLKQSLDFYESKGRFCYIQTPGFFERFNGVYRLARG